MKRFPVSAIYLRNYARPMAQRLGISLTRLANIYRCLDEMAKLN